MREVKLIDTFPNDIIRVNFRVDNSYIILKIKSIRVFHERMIITLESEVLESSSPYISKFNKNLKILFHINRRVIRYSNIDEILPILL